MIAEQKSQKNETVNNTYDRPATMVIIHLLSSWETDITMKCNPLNREKDTDKKVEMG
jgi:PIN domain nuclease of toxin-antitoxin system